MLTVQLNNIVGITDFRQNLSFWLAQLTKNQAIVLLQKSKPKAVVVDPDYLDYLEKYADGYYDQTDVKEAETAIKNGALKKSKPFHVQDYLK